MSANPATATKPRTVRGPMENFVAAIAAAKGPEIIADLWEAEWLQNLQNRPVATRYAYVTQYRNLIRQSLGDNHPALAIVKVLDKQLPRGEALRTRDTRPYGGRKPSRIVRIDAFIASAASAMTPAASAAYAAQTPTRAQAAARRRYEAKITDLWAAEIAEMRTSLANSSIKTLIAEYRNRLREAGLDHTRILTIVNTPDDITNELVSARRLALVERRSELVKVPNWRDIIIKAAGLLPALKGTGDHVPANRANLEKQIDTIAARLSRQRAIDIGLGLSFLTGRRPFEIFCQGDLQPIPQGLDLDPKSTLIFSGQAKTRAAEGTRAGDAFPIPVLAPPRLVYAAWHAVRRSQWGQIWASMTDAEFKADVLRVPNPAALLPSRRDEIFAPLWPQPLEGDTREALETKSLKAFNIRALYAEIAYELFCRPRPKPMAKDIYFNTILGHAPNITETALSYMRFALPDLHDPRYAKRSATLSKQKAVANLITAIGTTPAQHQDPPPPKSKTAPQGRRNTPPRHKTPKTTANQP